MCVDKFSNSHAHANPTDSSVSDSLGKMEIEASHCMGIRLLTPKRRDVVGAQGSMLVPNQKQEHAGCVRTDFTYSGQGRRSKQHRQYFPGEGREKAVKYRMAKK